MVRIEKRWKSMPPTLIIEKDDEIGDLAEHLEGCRMYGAIEIESLGVQLAASQEHNLQVTDL